MNTVRINFPSNRVRDIERHLRTELSPFYPDTEIAAFTALLFEAYLGWDKAHLLLHRDQTINQSDLLRLHWAVERLKRQEPIQYIIGHTDFCGIRLHVAPGVLIPRPETEEIVLRTLAQLPSATPSLTILDLCTGSGCIALALAAHRPSSDVYGVDISPEALAIAERNAHDNHLRATFLSCDILHDEPALPVGLFDLIISNPPYIRQSERTTMSPNVLDHEPAQALFVPDSDPLLFYRAIGQYALRHLAPKGTLVLEINEALGNDTCLLLQQMGFATQLHKDFHDKDRSITAQLHTSC